LAELSSGQHLAIEQLRDVAAAGGTAIEILGLSDPAADGESARAEIAIDCSGTLHDISGIRLRARERFTIHIPPDFPFRLPSVTVPHRRWAGTPHVQWGRSLCLYAAPSTEWVPADGIRGLLERLVLWLEEASLGRLDPDDRPLHPPVAYTKPSAGIVVMRADIGDLAPPAGPQVRAATPRPRGHQHRFIVGLCRRRTPTRVDLVEWISPLEWLERFIDGRLTGPRPTERLIGALGVLTDAELAFEYPERLSDLFNGLAGLGVERADLLYHLGLVAWLNRAIVQGDDGSESPALRVFLGTPSRGTASGSRRQHLVCWQVDELGRSIGEVLRGSQDANELIAAIQEKVLEIADDWIRLSSATWERVYEDRPEVTVRRDVGSASEWLKGKRVLVLGCGALGAPIAEYCVRAGSANVVVVDKGIVTPGIIVRQPYTDSDIGESKASILAERLNSITQARPVTAVCDSVQNLFKSGIGAVAGMDLVIDATADSAVASLVELLRSANRGNWPVTLTVVIGQSARRGVVCVAQYGATGTGRDILRKLGLAARGHYSARLADVAAEMFPQDIPAHRFQPEPGCSSPTFVGSAAEVSALAGALLDAGLCAAQGHCPEAPTDPMSVGVVRLGTNTQMPQLPGLDWFGWPNDALAADPAAGYEVRISATALATMRAECRRGARLRGPLVETGGTLFGRIDDACRCVWVDRASGPPPDSHLHETYFEHGIEGVRELIDHHRSWSGTLISYLGMWHAHPFGEAAPSERDRASRRRLVGAEVGDPPSALLLIIGGNSHRWDAWLKDAEQPDIYVELVSRARQQPADMVYLHPFRLVPRDWPGGWRMPAGDATPTPNPLTQLCRRILGRP